MTDHESRPPIKPPQSRAGKGSSAVYLEAAADWGAGPGRVYVKRQDAYYCRPVWRLFRKTPMLRRELRGLRACRRLGIEVPEVISYQEDDTRSVLVLAEVHDALPLQTALAGAGSERMRIVGNVARAIGRLHRGGWSHGALYPDHLLVGPGPEHTVTVIDLEKARHSPLRRRSDLERFWRHARHHLNPAEIEHFDQAYQAARQSATG